MRDLGTLVKPFHAQLVPYILHASHRRESRLESAGSGADAAPRDVAALPAGTRLTAGASPTTESEDGVANCFQGIAGGEVARIECVAALQHKYPITAAALTATAAIERCLKLSLTQR